MPSEAHQDALDRTTTRMTEDPLRVTSPYRQRDIHGFVQAFSKTVAAARPLRLEATTARLLPPCRGFSQRPSGVLFDLSAGLDSTRPATRRRHPGTRPRCGPEPSHSFSLATTTTCIPAELRGCQNRPHLAPGHAPRLAGLAPRRPTEVPRLPDARLRGSRGDPDAEDPRRLLGHGRRSHKRPVPGLVLRHSPSGRPRHDMMQTWCRLLPKMEGGFFHRLTCDAYARPARLSGPFSCLQGKQPKPVPRCCPLRGQPPSNLVTVRTGMVQCLKNVQKWSWCMPAPTLKKWSSPGCGLAFRFLATWTRSLKSFGPEYGHLTCLVPSRGRLTRCVSVVSVSLSVSV